MSTFQFVRAANFTAAAAREIKWLVLHTMEAPEKGTTALAVAHYFQRPAVKASAHYCLAPDTNILTADLKWIPIGAVEIGQGIVAVDEFHRNLRGRRYKPGTVEAVSRRTAPCVRVTLEDGRTITSSTDHWWLAQCGGGKWEWVAADALRVGDNLSTPLRPWEVKQHNDLAWLAGLFDGEGSLKRESFELTFSQAEGEVMSRALGVLDDHGIPYRMFWREPLKDHHKKVGVVSISGVQANLELLALIQPTRFIGRVSELLDGRFLGSRTYEGKTEIAEIENVGNLEVVSIKTSARTFIAEGVVSHNCIDNANIIQCVQDHDVAWGAPGANRHGLHFEHAGYAAQNDAQWHDAFSTEMLALSARLVADKCKQYGIPAVWLSPADLKAGHKGITGHANCTLAFGGSHTDPGPHFPHAEYIAHVHDLLTRT